MKTTVGLTVLLTLAGSVLAADSTAKDQVIDAAKKLADQSNYSWKTTVVVPEGTRFRPGPTEGKTEKNGLTHVTMSFGERKMEAAMKGEKAAVTNQDGDWQSAEELENAEGPGRFLGMMVRNIKLPAAQALELAGYAKDLKKEGAVYSGTLTEEGVKALVSFRRRAGGEAPEVANPAGSARFWLKDGVLNKFEYQVKGSMSFNGNDIQVDRTTTVEIQDVGNTKVQVPEEARKKLS